MWDSTPMILHLEQRHPEPGVLPDDPVQRFLCFVLEDVLDEWFYRPAVGSRWFYPENTRHAGWELARDFTFEAPLSTQQVFDLIRRFVTASCEPMGVTADNIDSWIGEVLQPWLQALNAHFAARPYLFGERPSLADFALFGANVAHFVNDPVCRRLCDESSPEVVKHTQRLLEPEEQTFGDWASEGDVPETLIAVLADLGRVYLPWASRAARDGSAEIVFANGQRIQTAASTFLKESRRVLLARYVEARSNELDAVLERAGILAYFADFTDQAGEIPDSAKLPRPSDNQPFAPPPEIEANVQVPQP